MSTFIRLARAGDIDGIAAVWAAATAERDAEPVPPTSAARAVLAEVAERPDAVVVVADSAGEVIGFAAAHTDDVDPGTAEVCYVGVAPSWWGSGVAGRLLTTLTDALAADHREATLLVYPDNARAVRAYERWGWTRDAESGPIHPRSGRPQVRYRRLLADAGNVAGSR